MLSTEILLTVWFDLPSPITKVHKNICMNLNQKKFRTYFLASKEPPDLPRNISIIKTPLLRSPRRTLESLSKIVRIVERCNIVHTIGEPAFVPLRWMKRNMVLSLHGVPIDSYRHFLTVKVLSRAARIIHSVSEYTARLAKIHYNVESKVIYNGVDTIYFYPSDSHRERPRVLYLGRLIEWKKPLYVARLAKEFPNADFIIHGRAPTHGVSVASQLNEMAKHLPNLRIQSEFLSERELRLLYQSSDIFLFPSTDWCPLVVLEAMACGIPLLLHATGGQAEPVTDRKEGFLSRNYEELRNHLFSLLKDDDLRKEMGKQARETSLKYDWKIVAKRYESMYKRML